MFSLRNIFKRSAPPVNTSTFSYSSGYGSGVSAADLLKNPTVVACTTIIARSISLLPLNLYYKSEDGRIKADQHPLYSLIKLAPNIDEVSSVFIEKIIRDLLQYGNAYIWKDQRNGKIVALYTLDASKVVVKRDLATHVKVFEYLDKLYTSKEIVHIIGNNPDGLIGYSPAKYAAEAISMGVKLDRYAKYAFDNGPSSKIVIDVSKKFPGGAHPDQVKEVAEYISRNYGGAENAEKPLILFDGMTATPITAKTNKEAELIEARQYQQKVIAQIYQVPEAMLGNGTSYDNYEKQMLSFLTHTLGPWMKRIEQSFALLLSPVERESYYWEFDTTSLVKADLQTRASAYAQFLTNGVLSVNEVRQRENLPKLEDADAGNSHFVMANLMPLNKEVLSAYMASQKLKQLQVEDKNPAEHLGKDNL